MSELTQIWNSVIDELMQTSTKVHFELYFSNTRLAMITEKRAVIGVFSEFKESILRKKYKYSIETSLTRLLGRKMSAVFYTDSKYYFDPEHYTRDDENKDFTIIEEELIRPEKLPEENINIFEEAVSDKTMETEEGKYTFDNFIVGNSNKFAHAAALSVAEEPAKDFNPLFIYGDSGLGKTHLLYAITGVIRKNHPDYKIIYVKSEDFTNEIILSIRNSSTEKLREKYRTCDILLIDDVQFISKKYGIQEEYLNTFNALYEAGKQIILTSDKPPKQIEDLATRLLSRFEWGLVADITPPDYDLRIAIMQQKCEEIGLTLSGEVLDFLSINLTRNVRQLEGAIKKIAARKLLMGDTEITLETAETCISDLINKSSSDNVTEEAIFNVVTKKYGVSEEAIKGSSRVKEVMEARRVTVYLLRELMNLTFPAIADIIPRNHTSVMHLYNAVSAEIKDNSLYERNINNIISEIKNPL